MELSKSTHAKIQVSRNPKRRTREGIETLTLNVETILPTKDTSQGSFAELEATIRRILTGLNEVAPVSANPPIPNAVPFAASSNPQTTDEYHTAIMTPEGVTLAHLSLQENTLQVSVVEGRRLRFGYAPVQSFLIPRILDAMRNDNKLHSYEFEVTHDGCIIGIKAQFPTSSTPLASMRHVKNLVGAIAWTLRALAEK